MMHFLVQIWKASLYLVLTYRPDKLTSPKWGKFGLSSSIWPWRSLSITPQNNRDLNQGLLHLWSKFGDPSLNGWWIIARTSSWLTDTQTHTHTHAGNDNTRRPKLASGKNDCIIKRSNCIYLKFLLNMSLRGTRKMPKTKFFSISF